MDSCIGVVTFGANPLLFTWMEQVSKAYPRLACAAVDHSELPEEDDEISAAAARLGWTYLPRENGGFAAGVQALLDWAAPHAFLFVVNPDVEFRSFDAFERCWEVARSAPQTFAIGTTLHDRAGRPVAGPLPPFDVRLVLSRGRAPLPTAPATVPALHGAFIGLNVRALQRWGPLDASLFLYAEEFDWACIAHAQRHAMRFVPSEGLIHHGEGRPARPMQLWMNRTNLIYLARKWRKPLMFSAGVLALLTRSSGPWGLRMEALRWALRPLPRTGEGAGQGAVARDFWTQFARKAANSGGTSPV